MRAMLVPFVSTFSVYALAFATYAIAALHFLSEILVFRTVKLNVPVIMPVIVSSKWLWDLPDTSVW
jgi:hypothetical protein